MNGRARRRRSLSAPENLDTILDRSGEARFARQKPPFARELWVRAVGARIAERTVPLRLENGELLVLVATHVWSNELSMLSTDVLRRLVSLGVPAIRLRFRVGSIEIDRPPERRARRKVPKTAPLPDGLAALIATVGDDELARAMRGAAEANLAWQTRKDPGAPPSPGAIGPAARVLRGAEAETDPQAQGSPSAPESGPRSPEGARRRRP